MTLHDAINGFIRHCRFEKNLSCKTIEAYTIDLNQFSKFISSKNNIETIQQIDKNILKEYLQTISTFKTKTTKRKVASLKAMFNYLEYENDDFNSPFRRVKVRLKDAFTIPTVMTAHEVRQILEMLYKECNNCTCKKTYRYKSIVRDIAVIELLFATGIRVSELCQLKTGNINLERGIIRVLGKGNKERIIQFCEQETMHALRNYANLYANKIQANLPFFINRLGNGLSTQSARSIVKNYIKQAKIEKHITPHTFRHTFATLLLEEDVDIKYIQTLLGHSSIAVTQIYTHVNTEKQKEILSTKHPRRKMKFL